MFRRFSVSIAFVVGGMATLTIFWLLHALGRMEGGMSAGPISASISADALIPWFAASYFIVSAVGILIAQKRNALRIVALFAHLMLLITFSLLCAEIPREEGIFSSIAKLAVVTTVFFSPWFAIWYWVLTRFASSR